MLPGVLHLHLVQCKWFILSRVVPPPIAMARLLGVRKIEFSVFAAPFQSGVRFSSSRKRSYRSRIAILAWGFCP